MAILSASIFPASAAPTGLANCRSSLVGGEQAVTRLDRFGALKLRDGRSAWLEGIRLPLGALDHAPERFAKIARVELSKMVKDQTLHLVVRSPEQDRYGRLRAQMLVGKNRLWVQQELLRRGLARVDIAPLHPECANVLYAAEDEARVTRRGLWVEAAYAVRSPDKLSHDTGTFQIVRGKVVSAAVRKSRAYLDFGEDWRTDFTVTIAPDDMRGFHAANIDPLDYVGKIVQVRGMIDSFHGPEMAIASPASVQVLKLK